MTLLSPEKRSFRQQLHCINVGEDSGFCGISIEGAQELQAIVDELQEMYGNRHQHILTEIETVKGGGANFYYKKIARTFT